MNNKIMLFLRNSVVKRTVAFIPCYHIHVKMFIEAIHGIVVFQETAVNDILGAHINMITHPAKRDPN